MIQSPPCSRSVICEFKIEQMPVCVQANEVAECGSEFSRFCAVETQVCLEPRPLLSYGPL